MAVYNLKNIRMVPCRYLASTGATASHEASEDQLAVDERGNVDSSWKQVERGAIAFTDASDYDGLTDEQQAKAVYSPFPEFFTEQLHFGAVSEVGGDNQKLESKGDSGAGDTTPTDATQESATAASSEEDVNVTLEEGDASQDTPKRGASKKGK